MSKKAFEPPNYLFSAYFSNLPERSYCISVSKQNVTSKNEGRDYEDFNGIVAESLISWVNCCVENPEKMLSEIAENFGFRKDLVQALLAKNLSEYVDFDTELGLLLPAVRVDGLEVQISPVYFLIKKHLIVSIHGRNVTRFVQFFKYAETFVKKIPKNTPAEDRLTLILIRLLDKNNEKNFENLRYIEEEGDKINALLIDPNSPRSKIGTEMYKMKHALISYLGALWGSLDVVNSLRYGDSELITDNPHILKNFSLLAKEITTQISISEHMSEVLASGLEVLQSIYNNQLQILNNRLSLLVTWLSILGTAIVIPNTLGTIFGIPAISDMMDANTIILVLVVSTIVSAIAAYLVVKKFLPRQMD
ncbi:MAG: CorA family divalent cation transporter [Candidatus Diapherotrites archaeon]